MIDFSKQYTLKQNPKKDGLGLGEKGLSKFPGTGTNISVYFDPRTKKYLYTGLDEFDAKVLALEPTKREKEQKRIVELRQSLENQLGRPGCLNPIPALDNNGEPLNSFWDEFVVTLWVGSDLQTRIDDPNYGDCNFDMTNPMHQIALLVAKERGILPFGPEEANHPGNRNNPFYATSEEEEITVSKTKRQKTRESQAFMLKLFDEETPKKDLAWEISYMMGLNPSLKSNISVLEEKLDDAIKETDGLNTFLEFCKMDESELFLRSTVKKAMAMGIIKLVNNVYTRGSTNFGDTYEKTVNILSLPEMATEYGMLKEEIAKKLKGRTLVPFI